MKAVTLAVHAPCVLLALLAVSVDASAKDIGTDAVEGPPTPAPAPEVQPVPAVPATTTIRDATTPREDTRASSTFDVRRLAIEGHIGFGTPVGAIGGIVEYAPVPIFGLGVGAGAGSGPSDGNHFHGALVARLRPLRGPKDALVIGLAYSAGGYQRFHLNFGEGSDSSVGRADWAHWAQADLGWERRSPKGFLIRLSLGGAAMLNPADLRCPGFSASSCGSHSETLVTFDVTLGYAAIL